MRVREHGKRDLPDQFTRLSRGVNGFGISTTALLDDVGSGVSARTICRESLASTPETLRPFVFSRSPLAPRINALKHRFAAP
jgi:hypothetical protein